MGGVACFEQGREVVGAIMLVSSKGGGGWVVLLVSSKGGGGWAALLVSSKGGKWWLKGWAVVHKGGGRWPVWLVSSKAGGWGANASRSVIKNVSKVFKKWKKTQSG